jgi:hypothetical protein
MIFGTRSLTGYLPDLLIWGVCRVPFAKTFLFRRNQIKIIISSSRPTEGRLAIVTDAGRDAVDADGAFDERRVTRTAKSCGPDAPTLAFKSAQKTAPATVTNKPGHRGDHEGNR